ncbi:peptide-methionine (S)-S-oxide reductase [Curtobacterium herbarum]|nr:peptide-methionine (S)-S-oxide reductase [Curtobacterium herbarum]
MQDVVSGYVGGSDPHPTYEQVCTGTTGHAEAVAVTFDESVLPAQVVLDVFFTLHDPRQLNRQGADVGTQYRSAMFPADDEQRALFAQAIERAADMWDGGIVTTIEPLGRFHRAEEYHQDFFAKNPGQGYCLAVALPKVNKVRKAYSRYILAS